MLARPLRPHIVVHDNGAEHWRGGQVWTITGETATIRLMAEANYVRDKSVSNSLLPGLIVGDAVVCKVTGTGADDYQIVEVRSTTHLHSPGSDQVGSVARGIFSPGVIPWAIRGGRSTYDWVPDVPG